MFFIICSLVAYFVYSHLARQSFMYLSIIYLFTYIYHLFYLFANLFPLFTLFIVRNLWSIYV